MVAWILHETLESTRLDLCTIEVANFLMKCPRFLHDSTKENFTFRKVIATDLIDFYIVHVGGLLYDLTVGFLLLGSGVWKRIGFLFSFMFHFMNSQLFDIGIKSRVKACKVFYKII